MLWCVNCKRCALEGFKQHHPVRLLRLVSSLKLMPAITIIIFVLLSIGAAADRAAPLTGSGQHAGIIYQQQQQWISPPQQQQQQTLQQTNGDEEHHHLHQPCQLQQQQQLSRQHQLQAELQPDGQRQQQARQLRDLRKEQLLLSDEQRLLRFQAHTSNIGILGNRSYICATNCTCTRTQNYGTEDSFFKDGLHVNCSDRNYTDVPNNIPNHTTSLCLDNNELTFLKNRAFENLTRLITLSIRLNRIHTVNEKAFANLHNVRTLNLYFNAIVTLPEYLFSPMTSLTDLNLSDNWLAEFNPRAFFNVTKLEHMDLSVNSLNEFPLFVFQESSSYISNKYVMTVVSPNLTRLNLDVNNIIAIPTMGPIGLDNLKYLNICCNRLWHLREGNFRVFPKLVGVVLHRNEIYYISNETFKNATSLKELNLRYAYRTIYDVLFQDIRQLEVLQLTETWIGDAGHTVLFQNLSQLRVLDIESTKIKVYPEMFMGSTAIETLNMRDLSIEDVNATLFKYLTRLTSIQLSTNRIGTLNASSFPAWMWSNLTTIDLSDNPFHCDCDLVWFRGWLNTTKATVVDIHKPGSYPCMFPLEYRAYSVMTVPGPSKIECFRTCDLPCDLYFVGVILFNVGVAVSSLIGSLLHRHRWDFRYCNFLYKKNRREFKEFIRDHKFKYDAFVCYCERDTNWVRMHLIPNLEGDQLLESDRLHLCIHHRDWLVGQDIIDNVVKSIESSRKTVLIVSNAFAESQWCHFELTMAQTRMFSEDRDSLVLVLLEEISAVNISPRLRHQMERQTYLEWTANNARGQQLFWARLKQALRKPATSVMHTSITNIS